MKPVKYVRYLSALLAVLVLLATPVFAGSYFDYTDDILEDGSPIYYFQELSLRLPPEWRGKIYVDKGDSGVRFYHKASREKYLQENDYGGGFLFEIAASVNQSFTSLPSFKYVGFSENSAMNYYLRLPTDFQAYPEQEIMDEYSQLFSQIDYIVEHAQFYQTRGDSGQNTAQNPQSGTENTGEGQTETKTENTWTPQQVRYSFEHSMMPRLFYEKADNIMDGIREVGVYTLWEIVCDDNGVDPTYPAQDYAENWYTAKDGTEILQCVMPEPDASTLCYRVYFVHNEAAGKSVYYTVESDSFAPEIAFICTWSADRQHQTVSSKDVLDRTDSDYEAALEREVSQIAQLADVSTELTPAGSSKDRSAGGGASADAGSPAGGSPEGTSQPADGAPKDPSSGGSGSGSFENPFEGNDNTSDQVDENTPDPDLTAIECREEGFTIMADKSYSWDYREGTGITVYTETKGSIPYVIVYQGEDLIGEPFDYIKEQYTPYMQSQYGNDLVNYVEIEEYDIGGKKLPAGVYTYRLQGYLIDMVRIYDSTGSRTVAYTAKYIQDRGETTLKALDNAVRYFQAD